jgi:class 3 adenylate cyclase
LNIARPETRYIETPLGFLAYQAFGEGERDVMFVSGAISNLDAIWDEPSAARFLDRLSGLGRIIHYDMRGSGVSDPIPGRDRWMTIEETVDDVMAVLDAVGSDETVLYGDTEGGFFTMMTAAIHPDRVSSLVLVNSYPRLLRADDYPIGAPKDLVDGLAELYGAQHGATGDMLELTAPSVANDPRFRTWFVKYQRMSVPMGFARSTFEWLSEIDVRPSLPEIQAPTLVVGRRDARFHRLAYSEFLAEHISGAELAIVDGADTLPFHAGEFGPILDQVEEFLTGHHEAKAVDRVLATVLFTDIVDSTRQAAEMGDQRWLDLLSEHDLIVASTVDRFRGRLVKSTGDGILATFDGPARAVTCATVIRSQLASVGLSIRAGVHTGEVEMRGGDIAGLGVHIASRVMGHAHSGSVLVSGTVKDLVVGSGISFDDLGTHALTGVPGQWSLFQVRST